MIIRCRRFRKKYVLIMIVLLLFLFGFYLVLLQIINILINMLKSPKVNNSHLHKNKELNVIVAHYIGSGNLNGNFPKDLLNHNLYAPVNGEGDMGNPVVISAREILKMQHMFQINRYNLLASDRIPLNRSLPDVRKKICVNRIYPDNLPNTSIIIVFHNEAWSVLFRTIWSVINRSPHNLIKEIILVDDASDREFLKKSLDDDVKKLPIKTIVLRQKQREGLVPARILGANYATGSVLTFLDAHCECTIGWLEPLLARINQNKRKVVCPVIDIISDDNFGYIKSFELHWGAFNWQLHFRWYLLGEKELVKRKVDLVTPFSTPAMAGGLFSINKDYFFEIGAYDEQMKIWGGDNLEMSFRIWQCGGEIEIVPCSHVGHLFRKSSPYTFPGGVNEVLNVNLARTAVVWMDDWAEFFFKFYNIKSSLIHNLDVTDRINLRNELKCKSFKWYLDNIWTEHFFPQDGRFFGKIILAESKSTIYTEYTKQFKHYNLTKNFDWPYLIDFLMHRENVFNQIQPGIVEHCVQKPENQGVLSLPFGQASLMKCGNITSISELFVIKDDGHIMTNEGICLDSIEKELDEEKPSLVRIVSCAKSNRQKWFYNVKTQQIVQNLSKFCLTATVDVHDMEISKSNLTLSLCTDSVLQKWLLSPINWRFDKN